MGRTTHQARVGESARAAISRAATEHKAGQGLRHGRSSSPDYDPEHGPLADKAEAYFDENIDEPDPDLFAFEGARVARDPETGRFITLREVEGAVLDASEATDFLKGGGGSDAQERAVRAGFTRAARAKGWLVE